MARGWLDTQLLWHRAAPCPTETRSTASSMRPFAIAPLLSLLLSLLLALIGISAGTAHAQTPDSCRSTVTGDLRLHTLTSTIFGNTRTIRVLLPDDYTVRGNEEKRYPVLYLLDGQNLFDACLSDVSHREWQVDETVRRLTAAGRIPAMIVVGIDHAGRDRGHEFLPYADPFGGPPGREPIGKQWPRFVATEVMPLLNGTYRTLLGPENTGLGGSSYGGVATLHALVAAPRLAGYSLIESTPLWVGAGQVLRDTDPLATVFRRVWVGIGAIEAGGSGEFNDLMLRLHRRLESNFRAAGFDSTRMKMVVDPTGRHTEDAWAARLPAALEYLFADWTPPRSPQ